MEGRIILRYMLKIYIRKAWTECLRFLIDPSTGCCEYGNDILRFIKGRNYFEQLSDY